MLGPTVLVFVQTMRRGPATKEADQGKGHQRDSRLNDREKKPAARRKVTLQRWSLFASRTSARMPFGSHVAVERLLAERSMAAFGESHFD